MDEKIYFVDMDGVLSDFIKESCKLFQKDMNLYVPSQSIDVYCGVSIKEFWSKVDLEMDRFWYRMDKHPYFDTIMDFLKEKNWCILTSPSLSDFCASGKTKWLKKVFGRNFRNYMISPRKGFAGGPGKVLIDDKTKNTEAFVSAGGSAIHVPELDNEIGIRSIEKLKEVLYAEN